MCGICGIINYKDDLKTTERVLIKMRDVMYHRGPDDEGVYVDTLAALGHRRLSVIDTHGGAQPLTNEDSSIWVVYNGEIYNFQEIREKLISRGHLFKTKSDTEILVHLYETYQDKLVDHLNGMFSFAIWDKKNHKLLLARDRLGIKPLYYMLHDETLIFASEIKSLLEFLPNVPPVNEAVLPEYFSFRFAAGENTFFQGIKNLLPGHLLLWESGKIEIKKYWDIEDRDDTNGKDDTYYVNKIDQLLQDSISLRLISDVPLGTFNSGGVDSSLISSHVAKMSNLTLNTFSVGFNQKDFDERQYAHMVAKKYHTNHHDLVVDAQEYKELLPKVIWHHDEPLNHAHSVQIFRISQLAKKYVTVVLTGEGADELFAGYPRYNLLTFSGLASFSPFKFLINSISRFSSNQKLKKISNCVNCEKDETLVNNAAFVPLEYLSPIFNHEFYQESIENRYQILNNVDSSYSTLNRLLYLEQKTYLVSLLNRQDKMSMAASVESRVPFLDYRLVEFSFKIPDKFKIKYFQNKKIIKSLALEYLPRQIVYRKKSGFGVPIAEWLRSPQCLGIYLNLICERNSITQTYFNSTMILRIVDEHKKNKLDHSEFLWALINFELWYRIFYKNEYL